MSTTLNYDYESAGGQPAAGLAYQGTGGSLNQLTFNNIDHDTNDNTAFLAAVAVGEPIAINGTTWTVQAVKVQSGNVQFTVTPAAAAPPYGVGAFVFGVPPAGIQITIPAGQSLSDAADLRTSTLVMILIPTTWADANVSFQVSDDNVTFYDLFQTLGLELQRAALAGTAIVINQADTQGAVYFKVRSGSRGVPIVQSADQVLTLITV
jgi:hypothetical protein